MANEFFGVVTKNCKTVVVESSKKAVREEIAQRGVTKNNIAMFKCQLNGGGKIEKKLIHKPRFRLMTRHHVVLENACLIFLEDRMGA